MKTQELPRYAMQNAIPLIIGTVLLFAALLKAWDGGVTRGSTFAPAYSFIAVELALATACFVGFQPRRVKLQLLMLFTCFAGYTAYLLAIGAESCGCFGAVTIPPVWTLLLDVAVLALLWIWQPQRDAADGALGKTYSWLVWSTVYASLVLPVTALYLLRQPVALASGDVLADIGGIVILEPESWVGQSLPIANEVDVGRELTTGEWVILLYHHGCAKCQEMPPLYRQRAEQLARTGDALRVALIETPPHAPLVSMAKHGPCLEGRLSDDREWFVQTPVEIAVKDGRVLSVRRDL